MTNALTYDYNGRQLTDAERNALERLRQTYNPNAPREMLDLPKTAPRTTKAPRARYIYDVEMELSEIRAELARRRSIRAAMIEASEAGFDVCIAADRITVSRWGHSVYTTTDPAALRGWLAGFEYRMSSADTY